MIHQKSEFYHRDLYVRRAFSRAASEYDSLTALHQGYAEKLLQGLASLASVQSVLDVGMGTGWMTRKVKEQYPQALVTGMDFAEGMVDFAKCHSHGIHYVLADARHLPFKAASFDVILSNMAYQWVTDLGSAFKLCHDCLKPEGVFHFALFGRETYYELFQSLMQATTLSAERHNRLADEHSVAMALETAGFHSIEVCREVGQMEFQNMMDLLRWNKRIGANRLHGSVVPGKDALRRAADFYEKEFVSGKGIPVTFEIILGKGKK